MSKINQLVRIIHEHQDSNRDFIMCCSGFTGEGKTTFTIQVAQKGDRHFDLDKNIVYTRKDLSEKINNLPPKSFIVIDEAINILFARDFAKGEQKELIKLLNMCRYKNLCLLFNIPEFFQLDSAIRDSRIRVWGYIDKRGDCYLFEPDRNPFSRDKWHRMENEKILKRWNEGIRPSTRVKNYIDKIEFEDMNDQDKVIYEELRDRKRREAQEENPDEEINKDLLNKVLLNERNKFIIKALSTEMTQAKVSEIFGLSVDTIKKIVKNHKEKKLQELQKEDNNI